MSYTRCTAPAPNGRSRTPLRNCGSLGVVLLVSLTACDGLLDVDFPGTAAAELLDDPAMAQTIMVSALGDFECAYTNYVGGTASLTDEFLGSSGWTAMESWDRRWIDADGGGAYDTGSCTSLGYGVYRPLHTARFQAEDARARLAGFPDEAVPNRASDMATLAAYAGYSLALLGEGFCEMAVDGGERLSREDVFRMAETRFTEAITEATAAGDGDILNMAYVGRARVRLNLNQGSDAVADAERVTDGYVRYATRSGTDPRRWNRVAVYNHRDVFVSVHPDFRDLEVDGVPDPRVPVEDSGRLGQDGRTALWLQLKYQSDSDDVPIATWEEAQLIIAEIQGGQTAVEIINNLRERAGVPGTFESSDPDEILEEVLEERRRELYLQGHRLNDLLRHDLPFPDYTGDGRTHKGQIYGAATCLPLPNAEIHSNPNIS